MPQEHHVVLCYKCETFQVQIVKKVKKFECKMCGEKQSVKKEFGRGSGKDCHPHVQKLRDIQIQFNKSKIAERSQEESIIDYDGSFENDPFTMENSPIVERNNQSSKWSEFISNEESEPDSEEMVDPKFAKYTFERPNKRKRANFNKNETKITKKQSNVNKKSNARPNELSDSSEEVIDSNSSVINQIRNLNKGPEKNLINNVRIEPSKPSKWDAFVPSEDSDKFELSSEEEDFNIGPDLSKPVDKKKIASKPSKWDVFVAPESFDDENQICNLDKGSELARPVQKLNNKDVKRAVTSKPSKWDVFVAPEPFDEEENQICSLGKSSELSKPIQEMKNDHLKSTASSKQSKWDVFVAPESSDEENQTYNLDKGSELSEQVQELKNEDGKRAVPSKASKWDVFVPSKSSDDEELNENINLGSQSRDESRNHSEMDVKSIFKTDDEDLDDILNF